MIRDPNILVITKNFDQLQKALQIILFCSRNVHNPDKIIIASLKVTGWD